MTNPPKNRWGTVLKSVAQIAVGLGIVSYLVRSNWREIAEHLRGQPIGWWWFAAGSGICLAAVLLTFLRWYLLVWAQELPFRVRDSLRIGFIGYFFNLLVPGAVGGDLIKAVLLAREQERRTVAIATVLLDRIVGLFGLIVLAGLVTAVHWNEIQGSAELRLVAKFTAGLLAVSSAGMVVLLSRRVYQSRLTAWMTRLPLVGSVCGEAFTAMAVYRSRWRVIAVTVLMSVLGHIGFVLALRCGMSALSDAVPPARVHFMLAPLGLMVGAIPVTPGGLGLAEGAMERLFNFAGENGALALLMTLAFRAMQVLVAVVGMMYYLASRRETRLAMFEGGPECRQDH